MKIKKIIKHVNSFSVPAYVILKLSIIISCLLMAAAIAVQLAARGTDLFTYSHLCTIAEYLYTMPQSILLIGGIFSAVIEDISA